MKKDDYNFKALRKKILREIDIKATKRANTNPIPTREEIYIGAFKEELEPQVQKAVFEMYRKGYSTESSGFYGCEGEFQAVDGYFQIDDRTRERLYKIGVMICKGIHVGMLGLSKYWTQIRFYPNKADLKLIKKKWNKIAKTLPDLGKFAPPSTSGGAQDFRQKYCPENQEVEKAFLKHILKVGELHPDYRKKYQKRLKELLEK